MVAHVCGDPGIKNLVGLRVDLANQEEEVISL